MSVFLAIVAVVSGLVGLIHVLVGPGFVVPIWWILSLLSLVAIPVLAYLKRIALANEAARRDASPSPQPAPVKAEGAPRFRDPDYSGSSRPS